MLVRSLVTYLASQDNVNKEAVIVYGAGYTGHQLNLALQGTAFRVVAFVDDNPGLQGNSLSNIRIHPPDMLNTLMRTYGASKVLRSEEHTSELQSRGHLVCRLLLEKTNTYSQIQ